MQTHTTMMFMQHTYVGRPVQAHNARPNNGVTFLNLNLESRKEIAVKRLAKVSTNKKNLD